MKNKIKILVVVGARPNFIKIVPLFEEFKKYKRIKPILIHTGQHYDFGLSKIFFDELNIPKPDYNLDVGSGSHAWQTAKIMERLEPVILKEKPNLVIVVGDVNSTLAGALCAAKLRMKIAHVEAGLRSFDQRMPEEINRLLTDHISDFLFVTEPSGVRNLIKEGVSKAKIFYVGNIMIDALLKLKVKSEKLKVYEKFNVKPREYAVLTLHRPENVDDKKIFSEILESLYEIQKKIKLIWPVHPRTVKQLNNLIVKQCRNIYLIKPVGYLEMLNLMQNTKFVMSDSGGIQEETTVLGVPCLTLRKNTERPVTVDVGTNIIVGNKKERIIREAKKILAGREKKGKIPKYWDGKTAKRIVTELLELI